MTRLLNTAPTVPQLYVEMKRTVTLTLLGARTHSLRLTGGELFNRLTDENYQMNEGEVGNYIRQVCEGIKHMHDMNIIHLDVKVSATSWAQRRAPIGCARASNPRDRARDSDIGDASSRSDDTSHPWGSIFRPRSNIITAAFAIKEFDVKLYHLYCAMDVVAFDSNKLAFCSTFLGQMSRFI